MNTKIVTINDIVKNCISVDYFYQGADTAGVKEQVFIKSKFGEYIQTCDSKGEIIKKEINLNPGYVFRDDAEDNKVISCFKKTVKRMLGQDPKLQELYLLAKPTIKKCYKDHDKKGLGKILMWLISNQK